MSAEIQTAAEDAAIRIALSPEEPEAGMEFSLSAEIDPEALPEATDLVILDRDGNELGRADLVETDDGLTSEPLTLTAPLAADEQVWQARLVAIPEDAEDSTDEEPAALTVAFPLRVRAHPIGVVVWGLPPALAPGETFTLRVGLKCPCGCDTSGWRFALADAKGRVLREGRVGDRPWDGTEGLRYAELKLPAPAKEGGETWTVTAAIPDHPAAHAGGSADVRLIVRPAPEVTITVVVTEAGSGAPVPRAKVVAHPYRTLAGEDGIARLQVPKGRYTIQVSGHKHFASRTEGEVIENTTITAELEIDRDFADSDAWA